MIRLSAESDLSGFDTIRGAISLEWSDLTVGAAWARSSWRLPPTLSLSADTELFGVNLHLSLADIPHAPQLTTGVRMQLSGMLAGLGAEMVIPLQFSDTPRFFIEANLQTAWDVRLAGRLQFDDAGWTQASVSASANMLFGDAMYRRQWQGEAGTQTTYTLDVPSIGLGVTTIVSNGSTGLQSYTSWHAVHSEEPESPPSVGIASLPEESGLYLSQVVSLSDSMCGSCSLVSPAADSSTTLTFGEVMIGDTVFSGFEIRCTLGMFCWLDGITDYPSSPFFLDSVPIGNTIINGQKLRIDLGFSPLTPNEYSDSVDIRWCYAYWVEWEEEFTFSVSEMDGYYTARCIKLRLPMAGTALAKPEAQFAFSPESPTCGRDTTFDGTGSSDPNPGGEIVSYSWKFDDETTATGARATHRFRTAGQHSASLTVTNSREMSSDPKVVAIDVKPDVLEAAAAVGAAAAAGWATHTVSMAAPLLAAAVPGAALAVSSVIAEAGLASFPIDQLVVRFPDTWDEQDVLELISRHIPGARIIGHFSTLRALLIQFPLQADSAEDAEQEMASMRTKLDDILPPGTQLGKNYIGIFEGSAGTQFSSTLYDIDLLETDFRVAYDAIRAPEAWRAIENCGVRLRPVRIAVVDTGIDAAHEEFVIPLRGRSYVADENGTQPWYEDAGGHGTQISGIIGAENGDGRMNGLLTGCAGNYEMQVYRVMGDMFSVWDGLRIAVSRTEDELDAWSDAVSLSGRRKSVVLNISLGWDLELLPVGERVLAKNTFLDLFSGYPATLFVTSAGNGDRPDDLPGSTGKELDFGSNVHAPGGLSAPNNLTVAATDASGTELMAWSNYGSGVDIAAPGHEIFTSDKDGGYTWRVEGTSYAAAMVSGVAAAVLAIDPGLTPEEVKALLASSPSRVRSPDGSLIPVLDFADAVSKAIQSRQERNRNTWWRSAGIASGILAAGLLLLRPF